MQAINTYATSAKVKIVTNLYYPGYNADNVPTALHGLDHRAAKVNRRDKFLPYLAKSNWRTCNLAAQYGFKCADAFAENMGADYDSNGDGQIDSDGAPLPRGRDRGGLRDPHRLTLKGTHARLQHALRQREHRATTTCSRTTRTRRTITSTIGTGSGSAAPDFTSAQIVGGKNPEWNKWGHERIGLVAVHVQPGDSVVH